MSYSIHIIKSNYPWEASKQPITLEEWISLVEADMEMKMKSEFEDINPITKEKIIIKLENTAVYTYNYEGNTCEVLFTYNRGKISGAYVNDKVIEKMKEIATKLGCRVVGDEGEEY
ncbi:hypothetical protein [Clostridium sp. C8-1-8]|uniref:hypothetical protein n=1 Tax=Clostridium sp. C8-1-8 TaxID=2698831 RepID=UPI0013699678|nr:hypothetical protein [Clostridium sp. C8-1-8]